MPRLLQDTCGAVPEIATIDGEDTQAIEQHQSIVMAQNAIETMFNQGESEKALHQYKQSIREVLLGHTSSNIPPLGINKPEKTRAEAN